VGYKNQYVLKGTLWAISIDQANKLMTEQYAEPFFLQNRDLFAWETRAKPIYEISLFFATILASF